MSTILKIALLWHFLKNCRMDAPGGPSWPLAAPGSAVTIHASFNTTCYSFCSSSRAVASEGGAGGAGGPGGAGVRGVRVDVRNRTFFIGKFSRSRVFSGFTYKVPKAIALANSGEKMRIRPKKYHQKPLAI